MSRRRAFTLIELLVAMGIIVLLSSIALTSTRSIRSGLRLSGGVNTAVAALELARALAIENSEPVLVAFRPQVRSAGNTNISSPTWPPVGSESYVEIYLMRWTGESFRFRKENYSSNGTWEGGYSIDRWVPYPDIKTLEMPSGVGVAVPRFFEFDGTGDDDFVCTADFVAFGHPIPQDNTPPYTAFPFEIPAIMFDRTGAVCVNNPHSSSKGPWLDWDGNELERPTMQIGESFFEPIDSAGIIFKPPNQYLPTMYATSDVRDEPFAGVSPYISIFDYKKALEIAPPAGGQLNWEDFDRAVLRTNPTAALANASFVLREGRRITFNTYSGVPLK